MAIGYKQHRLGGLGSELILGDMPKVAAHSVKFDTLNQWDLHLFGTWTISFHIFYTQTLHVAPYMDHNRVTL